MILLDVCFRVKALESNEVIQMYVRLRESLSNIFEIWTFLLQRRLNH